jgi:hypothetical protein
MKTVRLKAHAKTNGSIMLFVAADFIGSRQIASGFVAKRITDVRVFKSKLP